MCVSCAQQVGPVNRTPLININDIDYSIAETIRDRTQDTGVKQALINWQSLTCRRNFSHERCQNSVDYRLSLLNLAKQYNEIGSQYHTSQAAERKAIRGIRNASLRLVFDIENDSEDDSLRYLATVLTEQVEIEILNFRSLDPLLGSIYLPLNQFLLEHECPTFTIVNLELFKQLQEAGTTALMMLVGDSCPLLFITDSTDKRSLLSDLQMLNELGFTNTVPMPESNLINLANNQIDKNGRVWARVDLENEIDVLRSHYYYLPQKRLDHR